MSGRLHLSSCGPAVLASLGLVTALATSGCETDDGEGTGSSGTTGQGTAIASTSTGAPDPDSGSSTAAGSSDTADDLPDCPMQTYYPDADEDGYGDPEYPVDACLPPPAHVEQGGDCDDSDPQVHPGVEELCDGVDNDCDALVDEASARNAQCQGCDLGLRDGHAYYYCPQTKGWDAARSFCMGFAADLVVVDDQAEHDFLLTEPLPAAPAIYLGLSDVRTEGTFVWVDGSPLGFAPWGMGEPNDALDGEDCAQLLVGMGTWNDIACDTPAAFVCESAG